METGAVESEETSQKNSTAPSTVRPRALVIDGPSLISAMDDTFIKSALLEFSNRCRAVIACRVSPDQKRALVNLVKTGASLCVCVHLHLLYGDLFRLSLLRSFWFAPPPSLLSLYSPSFPLPTSSPIYYSLPSFFNYLNHTIPAFDLLHSLNTLLSNSFTLKLFLPLSITLLALLPYLTLPHSFPLLHYLTDFYSPSPSYLFACPS